MSKITESRDEVIVRVSVGDRIRAARRNAGMTQKELAEMLGVVPSMIGQYEIGERTPKFATVLRLAETLRVSPAFLLGIEDEVRAWI